MGADPRDVLVPPAYQHRVLFYGILGALVLRGAFMAAGAQLLNRFDWIVYVFGALLLWSGVRLLRGDREIDPESAPPSACCAAGSRPREACRARTCSCAHAAFPTRSARRARPILGRWYATPLLAVLVVIEPTDVVFAVDSIPAIFGVTREPFIVFSATALAILGLRSLYFLLAGMRDRFAYLDTGLAVILVFIGVKFLLTDVVEIDDGLSLAVIVLVMGAAIGASLLQERRRAARVAGLPPDQMRVSLDGRYGALRAGSAPYVATRMVRNMSSSRIASDEDATTRNAASERQDGDRASTATRSRRSRRRSSAFRDRFSIEVDGGGEMKATATSSTTSTRSTATGRRSRRCRSGGSECGIPTEWR